MLNLGKKFIENVLSDWESKNYLKFIGKILLFGAGSFALVLPLTAIAIKVYSFVVVNWQFIFFVGGGSLVAVYLIKEHYADKEKERLGAQEQSRLLQEEADSKILERNYRLLRNTLFEVTSYIHDVIHVKKPTMETELDSPNHIVRKLNFVLYQFILYPTSGIDTESVKKILQQEYTRRLDAQSFSGIGQSYYFYEGQAEPIISIYEVVSNGAYLTVSLAIADENYCRHIRQGVSVNLLQQAEQIRTPSDKDF